MRPSPAHSRFHLLLHIAAAALSWTLNTIVAVFVLLIYAGVQ